MSIYNIFKLCWHIFQFISYSLNPLADIYAQSKGLVIVIFVKLKQATEVLHLYALFNHSNWSVMKSVMASEEETI